MGKTKKASSLILVFVLGIAVRYVFSQSYAAIALGPVAPAVANCPAGVTGQATLCPVGTAAAGFSMYVSYNGGAYQLLVPANAGVSSFNGRTGAVTLSKTDVTSTGIAATTTLQ